MLLGNIGCQTVNDLVSLNIGELENYFNNLSTYSKIVSKSLYMEIRFVVHSLGLKFKNEYSELGISDDILNIDIFSLNIPNAITSALYKFLRIKTLGELLTTNYEDIVNIRGLGEKNLEILKNHIHSLGYVLKGEQPSLNEIKAILKEQGEELLEETFGDAKLCSGLYKNGIYTIQELAEFGPDFQKLVGIGKVTALKILSKMEEKGISFNKQTLSSNLSDQIFAFVPDEKEIEKAKSNNDAVSKRLLTKEALLLEYEKVMYEKAKLNAREKELNELINSKVITTNVESVGEYYGRR